MNSPSINLRAGIMYLMPLIAASFGKGKVAVNRLEMTHPQSRIPSSNQRRRRQRAAWKRSV